MVLVPVVATHGMFYGFVCREIYRMRRTYLTPQKLTRDSAWFCIVIPAPKTTLEMPLHNDPTPSAFDIVDNAFDRPV